MGIKVSDLYNCSTCINLSKTPTSVGLTAKCTSSDKKCSELFNKKGTLAAKKCNGYKYRNTGDEEDDDIEITSNIQLEIDEALDELLSGKCKFILHSTKTNDDFIYRIDKKELTTGKGYIYFIHIMEDGKFVYAGNITFMDKSKTYSYRQGKNGNYEASDVKIKSLIFVLNNLEKQNYEMKLQIFKICES